MAKGNHTVTILSGAAAGALALAFVVALATQSSCGFDGYCLDCAGADGGNGGGDGNGGGGDGGNLDGGGGNADACTPSGLEICDGLDNDCNGQVDDDPGDVGTTCGETMGECEEGITACVAGELICEGGVAATAEECDNLDNDCDGAADEGSPGAGAFCGSDLGECQSSFTICNAGNVECPGEVTGSAESCDGLDNDCDGMFDENTSSGNQCGPATDMGLCEYGTEMCVGGGPQCVDAVFPVTEVCDAMDHDCDGDPLNGFDLDNDLANCGTCGKNCNNDPAPMGENAVRACTAGVCAIAKDMAGNSICAPGFFDLNDSYADGCEYACNFQGPDELCNGLDDNCNGMIDEGLDLPGAGPDICNQIGECMGTEPTCMAAMGWVCEYGPTVETDGMGNIMPEILCDDLDGDCDGGVDEAYTTKGNTCDDGQFGICKGTGSFICNATNDGVTCDIDMPGQPAGSESCNNIDDDCDNSVDENPGDLADWVDLGFVEMFAYEASRPDATNMDAGFVETVTCSKTDAVPWTNVTHPEAEAACAQIGARLCTEAEWQRACRGLEPPADDFCTAATEIVIEAEHFANNIPRGGQSWILKNEADAFAGGMQVPDDGTSYTNNAAGNAPELNYQVDFPAAGTYTVWIRLRGLSGSADSIHVGLNGADVASADDITIAAGSTYVWSNGSHTLSIPSAGVHTVNVWMREDGTHFDRLVLTQNGGFSPSGAGPDCGICEWSYQANCSTYAPDTCNGNDYDCDPGTAGDQDCLLPTGAMAACFVSSSAGSIFDMSGNVKEWTAERAADVNPIRGGSYNNTASGIGCGFDFLVADDNFFFPNVGFRCCR